MCIFLSLHVCVCVRVPVCQRSENNLGVGSCFPACLREGFVCVTMCSRLAIPRAPKDSSVSTSQFTEGALVWACATLPDFARVLGSPTQGLVIA